MSAKLTSCIELTNGRGMPRIGLGTWLSKPGEVTEAVKAAIDSGYRHIDCAYGYGNENEVGAGIKAKIDAGVVKREDLFIVGKLWNTRHSPNDVQPSLEESLASLGLDYLDLYHIHWPHAFRPGKENFPKDEEGNILYADIHYLDTYKALEKCFDKGLIKAIGLSNFNSLQIQDVLDNCSVKPANLQVEIHPYFSQQKLVKFCQEREVTVTAYSPLGAPSRPWVAPGEPLLVDSPQLKEIGAKYGKSGAQVVLRWLLQRNIIAIPKSITPSRIKENIDVFDFELTSEDMEIVSGFDRNGRLICPMVTVDGKQVPRDQKAPHFPVQDDVEF